MIMIINAFNRLTRNTPVRTRSHDHQECTGRPLRYKLVHGRLTGVSRGQDSRRTAIHTARVVGFHHLYLRQTRQGRFDLRP